MDNSETHAKAIRLGNELVKLLELERGGNTIARWMAHYLSEQMVLAETAVGSERVLAQANCFNTILKLWQHRSSMPIGMRPFEGFEGICRVLERLDPEGSGGFYRDIWPSEVVHEPNSIESIASVITAVDKAARVLIEQAVSLAAKTACGENDEAMLNDGDLESGSADIKTVKKLMGFWRDEELTPEMIRERAIGRIKNRIETLDWFENASKGLRKLFNSELLRLEQNLDEVRTP